MTLKVKELDTVKNPVCSCGHDMHDAYRCAHRDDEGVPCDCAASLGSLEDTLERFYR